MSLSISGLMPVLNLRMGHYPFVETALMALPIVDEFLVNDGGSKDGTLEIFKRLASVYPKIQVVETHHEECGDYSSMDRGLEQVLAMARGDWIIEQQADEYFHPEDYEKLLAEIDQADKDGVNSLRSPMYHIWGWSRCAVDEGAEPEWTHMRVFRNRPGITSSWGGDGWYIKGEAPIAEGYTLSNLPPERRSSVPIYHHTIPMPASNLGKAIMHVTTYAIDKEDRLKVLQRARDREMAYMASQGPNWLWTRKSDLYHRLPRILRELAGWHFYQVREELFDPAWVADQLGTSKDVLL